jgi:hypothetical protein
VSDLFIYDVFISYSHKDGNWVWSWLIPKLKNAGFHVCTDRESFDPGVPSLINMENAVASSRRTILVLSPAYVQSEWTNYEALLVQHDDPIGLRQRTLPVLYQACDTPRRIAMLTYVNLTGNSDTELEFSKLVGALRSERRLPDVPYPTPPKPISKTKPPQTTSASQPKTEVVRELLNAAFNDSDITTLCFDYFRSVYDDFGSGMGKGEKIQRLVEYCEQNLQMETLLAKIQKRNPYQYQRYRDKLL